MGTLRAIVVECRSLLEVDESGYDDKANKAHRASTLAGYKQRSVSDYNDDGERGQPTEKDHRAVVRAHEKAADLHSAAAAAATKDHQRDHHNKAAAHHQKVSEYHHGFATGATPLNKYDDRKHAPEGGYRSNDAGYYRHAAQKNRPRAPRMGAKEIGDIRKGNPHED